MKSKTIQFLHGIKDRYSKDAINLESELQHNRDAGKITKEEIKFSYEKKMEKIQDLKDCILWVEQQLSLLDVVMRLEETEQYKNGIPISDLLENELLRQ